MSDETVDIDAAAQEAGMRPCGWPDCPERFDAVGHIFTGANVQPGWRRSGVIGYLGPAHAAATHLPALKRTMLGADVTCECGWRYENPPTLSTAADLWRDHVRSVTA
jgi:hypothetical protein